MEVIVAREADLKPGEMLEVEANDTLIVIFKDQDGTISALEDRCSHAEVRLSGGTYADGVVECPAHGAQFNVKTGKNLCMPAVTPVKTYRAFVRDGNILIEL